MSTWNPKANDIFLHAIELGSAAERRQYLDAACTGDEPLRAEVEALLAAGDQAGSFLESPAVAPALLATVEQPIAERPGTTIGAYKLLEQIGEGGFGVVFMAEQTKPVRRKVALKVLKPGMDTRQIVARFEAERQALAIMDHPNIAKVHDGGATPSGRPYFVMELVKGVPITEFCDQNQLTPRQRLELFIHVCQAVQHAHQKGIIHRDLKPSNILVVMHDTTPVVKVIDFGVAKALGQELTDKTLFTGFAQMVGTPLYMSPEQAGQSGLDVDTRSDIYSLGVLLYELLTGTTPFTKEQFRAAGYDEIRRIIREEEPPKPSTRISTLGQAASTVSTNRKSDPKHLGRLLRGEVDWIVMKALEKDRNRRYETANGLARDIERYLHDEPVQACPPSTWYRFRKFARRKKIALAMAACVFLALSGIAGGVGWAVRDNAARDEANKLDRLAREKAVDQVVERNLDDAGPLVEEGRWPEALAIIERTEQLLDAAGRTERPTRFVELRKALAVAQRLEGIYQGPVHGMRPRRQINASPQPSTFEVEAPEDVYDEAFFWGRRQDTEFTKAFVDLGIDVETLSPTEAAEKIRRQSIRTALVRALDGWATFRKRSLEALRWRGEANSDWKKLIEIARQADADDWRNRCREALLKDDRPALEELADAVPVRQTPPESLYLLGQALKEVGAVDKAMTFLERGRREYPGDLWLNDALAHFSWSACQPPRWDAALRYYAAVLALRPDFSPTHLAVADALKAKGATDEALLEYSKAVELEPKSVIVWTIRGSSYRSLGRYDEAVADFSRAIELEPTNVSTWNLRSSVFLDAGQYEKALADAEKAVEILRKSIDLETGPTRTNLRLDLAHSLWHSARVSSSTAKHADAETALRDALKTCENLASQYPQERYYRQETAATLRQLFDVWRRTDRTDEAVAAMRRAIDLSAALVAEEPRNEFYRSELAVTCYVLADYLKRHQRTSEAEPLFQRAIDLHRALLAEAPAGEHRLPLVHALRGLAEIYRDTERLAEAEEAYRAALELGRQMMRDPSLELNDAGLFGWAALELAAILRTTGRAEQAND
ncbi:MAG TPA: serine/threonine-protein kinase, partial [Pirellulales bacterium]|nr:serine/threonine-protein kinase [Pirellulales bacterium]